LTEIEIIELFLNIILVGAAVTGARVAVKGLNTWRDQLKGQHEYELTRRILVALYKYRDAISELRNPVLYGHELVIPPEKNEKNMSEDKKSFFETTGAYQARYNKVKAERVSLLADLLEAEAIWGSQVKLLCQELYKLEEELFFCIWLSLGKVNPNTSDADKLFIRELTKNNRNIMYAPLIEDKPDEFRNEMNSAIQEIERYLKPMLTPKKEQKCFFV
jgi:hypothetical protein